MEINNKNESLNELVVAKKFKDYNIRINNFLIAKLNFYYNKRIETGINIKERGQFIYKEKSKLKQKLFYKHLPL